MKHAARVPLAGLILGLSAMVLIEPLVDRSSWWMPIVVAAGIAAVSAYAIGYGVNRLPGASPRAVATLSTVLTVVTATVGVVALGARLETSLQAGVIVLGSYVGFRLVITTVDQFTPSFTVSLLAGLAGSVVFAAAVPLLAHAHPDLSVWACIGIGAGAGYLEGTVIGVTLKPLFDSSPKRSA